MTQDEITALFNMGIAVGRQMDALNNQLKEAKQNLEYKDGYISGLESKIELAKREGTLE